jgi:hypothetical protein
MTDALGPRVTLASRVRGATVVLTLTNPGRLMPIYRTMAGGKVEAIPVWRMITETGIIKGMVMGPIGIKEHLIISIKTIIGNTMINLICKPILIQPN